MRLTSMDQRLAAFERALDSNAEDMEAALATASRETRLESDTFCELQQSTAQQNSMLSQLFYVTQDLSHRLWVQELNTQRLREQPAHQLCVHARVEVDAIGKEQPVKTWA